MNSSQLKAGQQATAGRKLGKRILQLLVLCLVGWGVWHSVGNSTEELQRQQAGLAVQAEELRQAARVETDPARKLHLLQQAERTSRKANEFWKASPRALLLAGLFYALGMIPPSLYWRRCLMQLEQTSHLLDILWAYFYGNLGKYFPGKAMVIVLRLAALEHHQVKKAATTMTIFMETLTLMAVGGAVAAVCLILLNVDWRLTALAFGLLLATFIPASPPVMQFLLPRLQRGVDGRQLQEWTRRLNWRLFFQGWAALTVGWILNGLSLMFVLQGLPSSELENTSWFVIIVSSCGACALAVVLGFVSLIPGGAGVREVVISTVLDPVVGSTAALCGALWLRVVWLCTELVIVCGLAIVRWSPYGTAGRPAVAPAHPLREN